MTPDSPEMSFFSVVSFVLSIYHKITEKISPKIGYLGNCTDGEIREDAGSDEKGGKTGVEKTCMIGYALSRSSFRFKKPITWVVMFTMLFSAGMIPTYIVYSKYYHISNSFWIYILPGITGGAWNTMVFRTFFRTLPESLFESARLDGANELTIFFKIVIPLSTPVFASLGFMMLVGKWNDYTTSMIYIRNENLYTLQYLLQKIMSESEFLKSMAQAGMVGISLDAFSRPSETLKFAMCIIAAGPMLVIFPFFQKYFSQGLTIGAVKG